LFLAEEYYCVQGSDENGIQFLILYWITTSTPERNSKKYPAQAQGCIQINKEANIVIYLGCSHCKMTTKFNRIRKTLQLGWYFGTLATDIIVQRRVIHPST